MSQCSPREIATMNNEYNNQKKGLIFFDSDEKTILSFLQIDRTASYILSETKLMISLFWMCRDPYYIYR